VSGHDVDSPTGADAVAMGRRLRLAFDMYEVGEQMQRQRLRREHPDLTDPDVEAKVREWRLRRPGAELGDAVGGPSRRFG
jgi:hypothetical protein